MKILLLAPHPFFSERGTPIAVRLAVEALCAMGHQVDLLTYHEGQDIEITGMRLVRISAPPGIRNIPIGFSVKKLVCDLWMAIAAYRLIFRNHYDVVHSVEESVFIALAARPFGKFRVVYDMDSLMADQIAEKWPKAGPIIPMLRWIERQAMSRADLVLPVCEAIAARARAATDPRLVHLLPDVAFPPPDNLANAEDLRTHCKLPGPLALYVGNLEGYQGVGLAMEALAAVPEAKRCNLIVIGGTPTTIDEHKKMAAAFGLHDNVIFLGQRPIALLGSYLRQADILCSPRLKGVNTPMKIYSYMAAGRAILATDIVSHTQVLNDECALLTAPTAAAMADGFMRLAGDETLRSRLGSAAATRATKEYGLDAFRARLQRAYADLAARSCAKANPARESW
jgi:glycosyltransferase involved in cell wall biosynthesis